MSDFISRYCEIVSLISRGSSEYSILGCRAICKEDFRIRIKEGKDSSSFFTGLNVWVNDRVDGAVQVWPTVNKRNEETFTTIKRFGDQRISGK